jgi:hypothetical protein
VLLDTHASIDAKVRVSNPIPPRLSFVCFYILKRQPPRALSEASALTLHGQDAGKIWLAC